MQHFILFLARGRPPHNYFGGSFAYRKVSARFDLEYQQYPHSHIEKINPKFYKRNFISISKKKIKKKIISTK